MRKSLAAAALALAMLLPAARAFAWGHKGHMTVAYIAYQMLTPQEKQKVFELLRSHPDFDMLSQRAKQDAPDGDQQMMLFVEAARWPDLVRDDPRFFDSTKNQPKTKQLPGFPDMDIHRPWHFKDNGFRPDMSDAPLKQEADNDAEAKIHDFEQLLKAPNQSAAFRAYYLAWLEHLVGDVHQPLHCATLVTPGHPNGDNGGNGFKIVAFSIPDVDKPVTNLHSFWDDVLGGSTSLDAVKEVADAANKTSPHEKADDLNEADWVKESLGDAEKVAYKPLLKLKSPASISAGYFKGAHALALERMKLAGARLAAVIEASLK